MFFPRHRPARKQTELFELRKERDAQLAEKRRVFGERALARVKARYDADPGKLAIRHLFAQAEIARLKHSGEMSKYSARDYCARVTDENSRTDEIDRQTLVHQTQPIPWH
jgi:hypothetical protein